MRLLVSNISFVANLKHHMLIQFVFPKCVRRVQPRRRRKKKKWFAVASSSSPPSLDLGYQKHNIPVICFFLTFLFSTCVKPTPILKLKNVCNSKVARLTGQCRSWCSFQLRNFLKIITFTVPLIHFFKEGCFSSSSRICLTLSASIILVDRDNLRLKHPHN